MKDATVHSWRLLPGGLLLLGLHAMSSWLSARTGLRLPPAIIALVLLLVLTTASRRIESIVTPAANLLVGLLGALLVPPLVGAFFLDLRWDAGETAGIALLLLTTTLATGAATALLARWLLRQ